MYLRKGLIVVGVICLCMGFSTLHISCSESESEGEAEGPKVQLVDAVEDTPESITEERPFEMVDLRKYEINAQMQLPQDFRFLQTQQADRYLFIADAELFALHLEKDERSFEEMLQYWSQGQSDYGYVGEEILSMPNGAILKLEKDGKIEYHVEYFAKVGEDTYRLYSSKEKSFSKRQATRMFHVCRTLSLPDTKK